MLTTEQTVPTAADGNLSVAVPFADFAPGIEKAFSIHHSERSYRIDDIEGQVPSFIRGTYYLNGPARFSRADLQYRHWLDGDGMVCSLRFGEESVHFTNRFVRTTKFNAEQDAGRPLFRTFGTAFAGDRLRRGIALESPANVSVYPFNGALLAFGEQALPWQLDAETLETVAEFDFGGALTEVTPFAAHPKFDPVSGEMFNFGVFFSSAASKLSLYHFDETGRLTRRTNHRLDCAYSIHDFSLSANYVVFYLSPYTLNVDRMVRGGYSLMDSLAWEPERGSRLLVMDRHSGEQVASVPLAGRYCLHLINSFDQGQRLTVDVIELDQPVYDQYQPLPELFTDVSRGGPTRLVVDLQKGELIERQQLDYRSAPDFPAIDPSRSGQPYRDFWMLGLSATGRKGRKFFDQLVHARWDAPSSNDIFQAAPHHYLGGEPIFIGGPEPGDGAVICQQFDADRAQSEFLVFDAFHVSAGPIATLRLKEPIYLGFHASFRGAPTSMSNT